MSRRGGRTIRGCSNTNVRGNSASRRRRRQWLLDTFGDGEQAPCSFCGKLLDRVTLTVDRIIPGAHGGRYVRDNIQPACHACNVEAGCRLHLSKK